tara:strand:- start:36 stop:170 length:135 start_codon:yes stop_codon:yes gene_type:complete
VNPKINEPKKDYKFKIERIFWNNKNKKKKKQERIIMNERKNPER